MSYFTFLALFLFLRAACAYSGQATYFVVGLGACGWSNVETDFIVALNHEQFDVGSGYPGPECGRGLTIYYNGKSAHATVADRCPSCAYGDLDMSVGLFSYFDTLAVGRFSMSWSWDGESSTPTSTSSRQRSTSSALPTQTSRFQTPGISALPASTAIQTAQASNLPAPNSEQSLSVLMLVNSAVINLGNLIHVAAMQ